ncbi:hypothetical protein NBRC10513_005874 [Rhodotorula toruloides]
MGKRFSYSSLFKRIGALLNQASRLSWTPEGQAWKSGVLSVASEEWLKGLAPWPGFVASTDDLKVGIERDRQAVQHAGSTVADDPYGLTFELFAQTLIGHAMYNAVVSVHGELSEAERLGIEYGKLLVKVCVGHLPDAETLLGSLPLIAWHDKIPDCPVCAYEYGLPPRSLASLASPFTPRARDATRQLRAF